MEFIDKIIAVLKNLRTEEIVQFFKQSQITELMHSPYFLGAVGVIIVICLIMKWRLLLATVIGIVGFAELLAYTASQETNLGDTGLGNDTLAIFIAGGIGIVSLVIYLLFIKSE